MEMIKFTKHLNTHIFRLPLVTGSWKTDVLPEEANREPVSKYFKGKNYNALQLQPKIPPKFPKT